MECSSDNSHFHGVDERLVCSVRLTARLNRVTSRSRSSLIAAVEE